MTFVVVIEQNSISGKYTAKVYSQHMSNGTQAPGRNVFEALHNLSDEWKRQTERMAGILANEESE